MKKTSKAIIIVLAVVMVVVLAVPAFAGTSYAPNGIGWSKSKDAFVQVKKADPKNVIKDGTIGNDEYERLNVDLGVNTSPLFLVGFGEGSIDNARAMLPTMEYYFSWDETHGFNFAVRNKPVVVQQLLELADGDCPEDDFARNTAYVISFAAMGDDNVLFFALAKRTDNDQYLEGYYNNQLGATGSYDPEPGTDYIITYSDDGYVTIEWSIPFNNFYPDVENHNLFAGTISATAGTAVVPFGGHDNEDSYAVTLGGNGYGVGEEWQKVNVTFVKSDDPVMPGGVIDTTPRDTDTTPRDTDTTPRDTGTTPPDTDTTPRDTGTTPPDTDTTPRNTAPRTGDPMIIMSAVVAASAAGIIVFRKKRR